MSSDQPIKGWRPLLPGVTPETPEQRPVSTLPSPVTPPASSTTPVTQTYTPSPPGSTPLGPPHYQRTPRKYVTAPQNEVEVQAPSSAPSAPTTTIASLLLPLSGTLLSVVLSIAFATTQPIGLVMTVPMLLGSIGLGVYNFTREREKYRQETDSREQSYRTYLADREQALDALRQAQLNASLVPNPDLAECSRRAERRDPEKRLWERAPGDLDFLDLRLGIGYKPASFSTKRPPSPQGGQEPDMLLKKAWALADAYSTVNGVAITLPLAKVGAVGIAGTCDHLQVATRALLMQLATHHAPNEVKVVLTFPKDEINAWAWARWLPHVWNDDRSWRFVASEIENARKLLLDLSDTLKQRKLQRENSSDTSPHIFLPVLVFVFANPAVLTGPEAAILAPLLRLLLTEGPSLGAYAIFLENHLDHIRKECNAVVDLTGGAAALRLVGPPSVEYTFQLDRVDIAEAERFARTLMPLRMENLAAVGGLPQSLSLLELLGVDRVEDFDVAAYWNNNNPVKSLATPVGKREGGTVLSLNLHEHVHGPHGLVAGMTRSGKTAFLSAFIALMAAHYHPHQVAFLVIDYKGGDLIRDLQPLPHLLGVLTNLESHLMNRALRALKSELQRRQNLFNQVGVGNIYDYQQLMRQNQAPVPLPHLLLISDEFAELVKEQPDFIQELVSTARVGGSLGIHLILATQQPAGVVNDQIWGNARFHLSFKLADEANSKAVLKRGDAAYITRQGQAYLQIGENEVFEAFQAAYGGVLYAPKDQQKAIMPQVTVVELSVFPRSRHTPDRSATAEVTGPTQLQALVKQICQTAERQKIAGLRRPWLPPLPAEIALDAIRPQSGWDGRGWQPVNEWLAPVIGQLDDPAQQRQDPLHLDLGREGHLAVYGAPGTGKTTLLQTLILSLALDHTPQEVNFYLLDFGGRLLELFKTLPHVGDIILPGDTERPNRLIRLLQREIAKRKELLSRTGVKTLVAYRAHHKDAPPALVVVLDNYSEFAKTCTDVAEELIGIANEGGSLGIHLVITAHAANVLSPRLSNSIALKVALELNDPGEYSLVVGRTQGLLPARGVRGRGLIRGAPPLEFQTALPTSGADEIERSTALRQQLAALAASWSGPRAVPVPVLPAVVPLANILTPSTEWAVSGTAALPVPLGLDAETLEPMEIGLANGPHFLITGTHGSGKTTLLQSWLLALAERFSPEQVRFFVVDMGSTKLLPFKRLPHTAEYIEDEDHLGGAVDQLRQELDARHLALDTARRAADGILDEATFMAKYPALVMVIDNYDQFRINTTGSTFQAPNAVRTGIESLIRQRRGLGFHLIVAGPLNEFTSGTDLAKVVREGQTGFLLGSSDNNDLSVFGLRLPFGETGRPLLPGQGYYAQRGRHRLFKSATPHEGNITLATWLARLQQHQVNNKQEK